ncbi:NADase-type glycan-binding domain-containing protein [Streptomyces sp. NPDC087903]|uniref:NADase-type glycan-binding domain-containing protein n=1 Tax=Streptomyces sp. NPDC087903 TaxID=3365819 RepID=UPI0038069DFB
MTTTQNCADCGTRAEPGQSFCDACGAVLSWTDRAAARAASGGSGASGASGTSGASGASGTSGASGSSGASGAPGTSGASAYAGSGGPGGSGGSGSSGSSGGARAGDGTAGTDGGDSAGSAGSAGSPPAASAASPAASDNPAPPAGSDPGWDAFTRTDGGTGLARTQRELLGAGAATAEPGTASPAAPHASGSSTGQAAAPSHQDSPRPATTPAPSWARTHTAAPDGGESGPAAVAHPDVPPAATPPAVTPAVDETAATEPLPTAAPRPGQSPAAADDMADRARRLLVPLADPEPRPAAAPSVAPVLPGRPAAPRPQVVRAPGEELGADRGTPCPWCSTRNRPDRHFCTRCAMPMAGDGPTPGRLPWWRRLGFGNREIPWAGDRPRLRRTFDRILTWLFGAIVLTLLIVLAFNIPKGIDATRDHFAKRAPVPPDSVSASRSYPGHKPDLVFDLLNNTWWGPGVSESGKGQWIEARFDEPTRLLDLIITPGVSTHADQNSKAALPHRIKAVITRDDGTTMTRKITLDQGAGGQRRSFRVGAVTKVRFVIESTYRASASTQVSIAEIEFFGRSSANSS